MGKFVLDVLSSVSYFMVACICKFQEDSHEETPVIWEVNTKRILVGRVLLIVNFKKSYKMLAYKPWTIPFYLFGYGGCFLKLNISFNP